MIRKILIICGFIYFIFPSVIAAHPGNTDSSGGHTCRTNCDNWGLDYGEYHFHDSSDDIIDYSDSVFDYDDGYEEGYDYAYEYTSACETDYDRDWIGSQAYGEGYEDGIYDGNYDGLLVCYDDSYQAGMEAGEADSYEGIVYTEDQEIEDWYDETSYSKGYAEGYDREAYAGAAIDKEEAVEVIKTEGGIADGSEDDKIQITSAITIGSILGIVGLSIAHDYYRNRRNRRNND
ncbi:YHYH domain-containing protein [Niallia endozanthoxylica]|uniref:YHYH domain-containing protein n=1 Tax=Niallia endozanthoxylica TaxID=2036016 RepID=A0A5J5HRU5_9BACI|nr:YHYH domain-containing protein [Niallia endozanthoxylica]KAA9023552.1 YHYH domain-containing protein [Niallia endozanthoxylica]